MQEHQGTILEPGQESVWDYPRPPRVEKTLKRVAVVFNGKKIADTTNSARVLETSHPPVYYIPPQDILMEHITRASKTSFCEYKGQASYLTVAVQGKTIANAAWCYFRPTAPYSSIVGHVAFYPSMMDACFVDGEQVLAQEGDFYGGWITKEIVGPFKGAPDTWHW